MAKQTQKDTAKKKSSARGKEPQSLTKKVPPLGMPLKKENYILLAIGVGVIVLAYILMVAENTVDGLFGRTLSPIMIIAAYAFIVYAILYKKKSGGSEKAA
jgi:ABC-type uncharacterized transport system permease subunit